MYLLGYDIGSSSIKAALVEARSGKVVGTTRSPETEMNIEAPQPGFAEQDPEMWWQNLCRATRQLLDQTGVKPDDIAGIGIAYQMHGLVLADRAGNVLRPAIIWCDSRAVEIGQKAFHDLGKDFCLTHYLNSPGNFTASKLRWVREKEPDIFAQIHKIMLPGDFIAFKLTGEMQTTLSGLSEGIFWDFKQNDLARDLLAHYKIPEHLLPDRVQTFEIQGTLTRHAAAETGLRPGIPVAYRAGDQPNNALSLGVLDPGQVAATGGTSGVVYGISDRSMTDPQSRINVFAHVNHRPEAPRLGLLLCINGAGIQYAWLKNQMAPTGASYADMEQEAQSVPPGADGLRVLPFGNGAERVLGDRNPGARFLNIQFNRHTRAHFYRAALEGIAFSFVYGFRILEATGMTTQSIKTGNDNLFRSPVFASTVAGLTGCSVEVIQTTGAVGAAKAAGFGAGLCGTLEEALHTAEMETRYTPDGNSEGLREAYEDWLGHLNPFIR